MAINGAGQIITWSQFASTCYDAIIAQCSNIGGYNSIPGRIRDTQTTNRVTVRQITNIGIANSKTKWSAAWYANPRNLISYVNRTDIQTEWNNFLSAAGIDSRSNELIKAKELGLTISLYMQFLSYHLKPIYSRRQIYDTVDGAQSVFQGIRYKTGTVTPYFKLKGTGAIDPDDYPTLNLVKSNYMLESTSWAMFDSYGDPIHPWSYLTKD